MKTKIDSLQELQHVVKASAVSVEPHIDNVLGSSDPRSTFLKAEWAHNNRAVSASIKDAFNF